MRVASALGVSAEISGLPAAALEVAGDWQVMTSPALALAASVALLPLLPPEPPVPPAPLLALVPLDPLPDPPPPPPHAANANSNEESNNEWNFICEAQK
jgi:hypothetical protein